MPYKDKRKEKESKHDRYEELKKDPNYVEKCRKYRSDNAEKNREYQRIYKLEHADQLAELRRLRKHLWKSSKKAYQNEYARQYAAKFREKVIEMYGGMCSCCGESTHEFLQIDHINNDGAAQRKSGCGVGHRFYRWLVKNGCPRDAYRLLCCNCNFSRGKYGYCPHEKRKFLPNLNG